ncbi:unnamed protein product [Larinioides sclopetarius]|uniref:Membrane magnesium transporter n=1 Tax=Larinioides sclopetarius TaxID=280406 RepID=A0AAV2A186_9ARAC
MIVFIHATYSATRHRAYLKLVGKTFENLPCYIIAQTLFSFLLSIFGVTNIASEFKEIFIIADFGNKSYEVFGNRPSFYVFSHRGSVLSSVYIKEYHYDNLLE